MRIGAGILRGSTAAILLSLTLNAGLFPQSARVAVCRAVSKSATPNNVSLVDKVVAGLGDSATLASLKAIRYTAQVSSGTGTGRTKTEVTMTRVYPDKLSLMTYGPGGALSYLEASSASAFVQQVGGPKTVLPDSMRDELLKTVRLDAFYVGQGVGSVRVKMTIVGTEHVGDVDATKLRVESEGAEATWYVNGDGRLLRTAKKVPVFGGMADQVVDYLDWRTCDGLMVPFQRAITEGEKASEEKVVAVELNPSLDAPTIQADSATSSSVKAVPAGSSIDAWVQPKPFGFEMGMSKAQIIEKVGRGSIKEEKGDLLLLSTAPMPHPAFESYAVIVSPGKGLLKVSASGSTIPVNDEGDQLKDQFENIYDGLAAKYGKGKRLDFVRGSDVNKEGQFWMMTLLQGERTLDAYWNYEDHTGGNSGTGIVLSAKALALNKGYVKVTYEFPGWNAYVDLRKAKQDDVF